MVKTELKSLKDTLLSKYADIENVNGIKQILLGEASGMAKTVSWVRLLQLLSNGGRLNPWQSHFLWQSRIRRVR